MPVSRTLVRTLQSTLAALAVLVLLGSTAAAAQAGNGTIKAIKGGDRAVDQTSNRSYAAPIAGALFEYTTSSAKAADPASTGWTAFPAQTNASGTATVSVPAGTYFVRERTVPAGFSNFGPVKSLYFDPSSGVPSSPRPYVAKVTVEPGEVTEAYPNRSASGDPADWSTTAGGESGSPFVNVRDNQALAGSCGINILLVLDRSGSIDPFKSTYRDAAKAFVGALAGTPTQVGIVSFSAGSGGVSSYQDGSGSASRTHSPLDLSATGSAAALNATIDDVYSSPSGGTNWDAALQKASQAKGFTSNAATGQTANPDVVVFITDGNPTARSTDGSDAGSDVDLIDLTAGMASANLVKSQPARALSKLKLYALGVGSGVTADNLKAVSGPAVGEDYETPTVAQLTAKLTELAARTCGARVFVRKRLAGSATDRADWGFTATSDGGSVSYLDGNRRTHATAGGAVETGVILTQLPAGSREVTITEDASGQPLSDTQLDSVVCRSGGYDGAPVTPVATPAMGVKLAVQRGSTLYCTFTNSPKQPRLTVSKTPDHGTIDAGQDAVFTIVVANAGEGVAKDVTLSDQLPAPGVGGWVVAQPPSQGSCSVSAANLLTCTGLGDLAKGASRTVKVRTGTSNHVCGSYDNPAATASASNAPSASDGGKITCRKDAKVTVVKQLAPASDGGRFDLKVDAAVVAANVGDGGRGTAFVDPGAHTVSEAGAGATSLAAYDKSIACVKNGQPAETGQGASLAISVGYEDVVVCTITNEKLDSEIAIDKQVDRQVAHVGDTLRYSFLVTDGDSQMPIHDVRLDDPRCDAGTITGPTGDDGDALLEDGETWVYGCTHIVTDADPNPLPNTATVTGEDEAGHEVSDEDSTSVDILKPAALVVKEGNQFAYPGDTVTFTFAVTNGGNAPLSDVAVTDDRCAPVTGPTQKLDGDQDDLLETGEKWIFTCSKQIPPDHKIGDENPIRNVATATGKDQLGKTVSAQDDHLVRILHPAIDIEKSGPATAVAGTALGYTLTVTNPGDVPFAAQQVVVTDPRCEAPPAGPSTGADATPGQLDPGDTWTYTCTAQTAGQPAGPFVNTATVTGTDFNGRPVSDSDQITTVLEVQQVLPGPRTFSASARLRGPSGCVLGPFKATVRGKRIASVTFFRDGKRVKRIAAKPGQRKFSVKIRPGDEQGVHRVTAKVRFKAGSRPRTRTLRLSYQRCRRQIVRPRFTG